MWLKLFFIECRKMRKKCQTTSDRPSRGAYQKYPITLCSNDERLNFIHTFLSTIFVMGFNLHFHRHVGPNWNAIHLSLSLFRRVCNVFIWYYFFYSKLIYADGCNIVFALKYATNLVKTEIFLLVSIPLFQRFTSPWRGRKIWNMNTWHFGCETIKKYEIFLIFAFSKHRRLSCSQILLFVILAHLNEFSLYIATAASHQQHWTHGGEKESEKNKKIF